MVLPHAFGGKYHLLHSGESKAEKSSSSSSVEDATTKKPGGSSSASSSSSGEEEEETVEESPGKLLPPPNQGEQLPRQEHLIMNHHFREIADSGQGLPPLESGGEASKKELGSEEELASGRSGSLTSSSEDPSSDGDDSNPRPHMRQLPPLREPGTGTGTRTPGLLAATRLICQLFLFFNFSRLTRPLRHSPNFCPSL